MKTPKSNKKLISISCNNSRSLIKKDVLLKNDDSIIINKSSSRSNVISPISGYSGINRLYLVSYKN